MRGGRRGSTRTRRLLAALTSIVLPLAMLGAFCGSAPSLPDLSAKGDGIVAAMERFRAENGRYPDSGAEAGIALPETRYGPWRHRVADDRLSFDLSFGDYAGLDPFTLHWSSEAGACGLDR